MTTACSVKSSSPSSGAPAGDLPLINGTMAFAGGDQQVGAAAAMPPSTTSRTVVLLVAALVMLAGGAMS